ncbi:10425_t:CDS:2, partial [Funneliformis geosporum]
KTYGKVKKLVVERKISSFVNQAVEEKLEKEQKASREKLIADYKSTARSKEMREEDKVLEGMNYNYKPKQGKEKELEIANKIKKIRPSLVVSNDIQNEYDEEVIVVPLSSQELEKIRSYELLIKKNKENGLDENSKILFNRLRNIEKETRLGDYKIGVVNKEIMKEVGEKLKLVLDLEDF